MTEISESIRRRLEHSVGPAQIEPAASGWGLSGARVYRAETPGGAFCLRRWPPGTMRMRLDEVHRFMMSAQTGGCTQVPELVCEQDQPIAWVADGCLWDLSHWMPGRCLAIGEISANRIEQGIAAIGMLHRAVAGNFCQQQVPPALIARIARIDDLVNSGILQRPPDCPPELQALAHRATVLWNTNQQAIRYRLNEFATIPVLTQWVLRDVHREHLLFTGLDTSQPAVSAIVDYDAVRIDTPATDLARFLGSWGRLSADDYASAINRYRQICPLSDDAARLIPLLDAATCLIACANWTVWLCIENRVFAAGAEKAAARFRETVQRAEMLFP